jgi:hypothetical protein
MHVNQKDAGAAINSNKIEIDFEFPTAKSKNNNISKIEFEIENIFNFNSDAGKSNKESYLMLRLYTAISIKKIYLRESFRIDNKSDFTNIKKGRLYYIKN